MGFVLLEDDQQCTLEAVLAFLDEDEELHHGTSSDSNSDYPPTSPEREEVTTGATAATTGWIQIPQRPVVSSEPKSSRATRDETVRTNQRSKAVARRQQIESILVRNEVHELEKVLRKLQRAHETRKRNSKWYRVALAQAQERYKSETLNRKLKNAVAKRLSSSQLLQEAFVISATSEDLELLSGNQRLHLSCHRSVAITEEDAMHAAELQALVPKLYALCDVVLDRAVLACGDVRKTSWAAKVKHDPLSGPFMELKLQTRLPELAFHDFSDAIWESMINERTIGQPLKLLVKSRNVTNTSYQKTYTLEVDSPFGPVNFNGVSFARRFVEPQRIVHVCSSVLTSPTDGQKFRERGWVAASPNVDSEDITGSGTVVHFGYQIFSGSSGSGSLSLRRDHQATTTSNTILRALGDRPRIPIQQIQKMMRDLLVF